MKKFVAIDMSRAYLLARHSFEARKVIDDDWLSWGRRVKATVIYKAIGQDFNQFFINLKDITRCELHLTIPGERKAYLDSLDKKWHALSVHALETFRDNLDKLWHFAYSGNMEEIKWLSR